MRLNLSFGVKELSGWPSWSLEKFSATFDMFRTGWIAC